MKADVGACFMQHLPLFIRRSGILDFAQNGTDMNNILELSDIVMNTSNKIQIDGLLHELHETEAFF